MTNYNLNSIIKIKVIKKYVSKKWIWVPKKLLFGFINKPGYFYRYSYRYSEKQQECPHNHYRGNSTGLDSMIVYENPQIILWLKNGMRETLYFDTVK